MLNDNLKIELKSLSNGHIHIYLSKIYFDWWLHFFVYDWVVIRKLGFYSPTLFLKLFYDDT